MEEILASFGRAFDLITSLDRELTGIISLSHIALPFPPDDPLYGRRPPGVTDGLFLGDTAIKGERGLLKISESWMLRLRFNPFYDYLEARAIDWIDRAGNE